VEWGEDKKILYTTNQCKDPRNHCNHYNIDSQMEEKCWKLHLDMNPMNWKKAAKKKSSFHRFEKSGQNHLQCG
jgi:hypothetical protein